MASRTARQSAIKEIILGHHIQSQEELLHYLAIEGIVITQATLSRDLKALKVGKVSDANNGYYYTIPGRNEGTEVPEDFVHDFLRGFTSLDVSANLGVIKTIPGYASSVAVAIDNFDLQVVLGTIAGDDTIMIVLQEGVTKNSFIETLTNKVPELEAYL